MVCLEMLCFDASKRCHIQTVLNHAYIRGGGGQTVTLDSLGRQLATVGGNVEQIIELHAKEAEAAADDVLRLAGVDSSR